MELLCIFLAPGILVTIDFLTYLITGRRIFKNSIFSKVIEVMVIVLLPLLYISALDYDLTNDCCYDSATFSPEHRLSVYVLIIICVLVFLYSLFRKGIAPPIPELFVNSILFIAIIFNVFIAFQVEEIYPWIGNLPIIFVFSMALMENQKKIIDHIKKLEIEENTVLEKITWKVLRLKLIYKVPVFFAFSIPFLLLLTGLLLVFGQKPDSFIRAFTDTYHHGFSELNHMCDNVECGGHFLCSVAANGHTNFVKPERLGERRGKPIICNRQLLVSNAFEELIEQKAPKLHKVVRKNYNKVGDVIHKHYAIFNSKLVSDIVYVLMKPLEWMFVFTLYCFDENPENRIAKQYISQEKRSSIDNQPLNQI